MYVSKGMEFILFVVIFADAQAAEKTESCEDMLQLK